MSALCGPGCGWCGRCTAAWEEEQEDGDDVLGDRGRLSAALEDISVGGNPFDDTDLDGSGSTPRDETDLAPRATMDGGSRAAFSSRR